MKNYLIYFSLSHNLQKKKIKYNFSKRKKKKNLSKKYSYSLVSCKWCFFPLYLKTWLVGP